MERPMDIGITRLYMHFFNTYNEETKASIVESFNTTLKTKMWKYFTHRETLTYVDVLSEMVASYNPGAAPI
jgi:hypothetical protein